MRTARQARLEALEVELGLETLLPDHAEYAKNGRLRLEAKSIMPLLAKQRAVCFEELAKDVPSFDRINAIEAELAEVWDSWRETLEKVWIEHGPQGETIE